VTTLALGAAFNRPSSIAIDAAGDVYVSDNYNNTIRRITPGGNVTTLAGPVVASLKSPGGVATDSAGNVYVADANNNTTRRITASPAARP
jgi:DNA-binding beta-propeller fold protein YncE